MLLKHFEKKCQNFKNIPFKQLQVKNENETKGSCPICSMEMNSIDLNNHLKDFHKNSNGKFRGKCLREFGTLSNFLRHFNAAHLRVNCEKRGKDFKSLQNHRCSECQKCGKMASNPHSCFPCKYCSEFFTTKNKLIEHNIKVHEKYEKHNCAHCENSYKTKDGLRFHVEEHHSTNGKKFECDVCGKNFASRRFIQVHVEKHRKTECEICKSLITRENFKAHLRDVHSSKPFKCKKCPSKTSIGTWRRMQRNFNVNIVKKFFQ